jgi:hypothetical protein
LILQIEGIPSKAKTLRINMTLAKLYRMTGYDRAATAAYKECLRFLLLLHFFSSLANLFVLSILHLHVLNPCSPSAYFELYISIEMDVVVAGDLVWLYGLLAQLMRQIPSLLFFLKFLFPPFDIPLSWGGDDDGSRQCPYVLEAIVALAELGTTPKEIHSLFPQVYINQQMQAGLC